MSHHILSAITPLSCEGNAKYGQIMERLIGCPNYRSISLMARNMTGEESPDKEWIEAAATSLLLKRLFDASLSVEATIQYYKRGNLTWSHKLYIFLTRLSFESFRKFFYLGMNAFMDSDRIICDLTAARDKLAEFIGRLYRRDETAFAACVEEYGRATGNILDDIHGLCLSRAADMHRPSFLQKHFLKILGYPMLGAFMMHHFRMMDLKVMDNAIRSALSNVREYCNSRILEPAMRVVSIVRYPHERPLTIMSEENVHRDQQALLCSMLTKCV
jgi:hypothetical protein